jgi:hypothetical protein
VLLPPTSNHLQQQHTAEHTQLQIVPWACCQLQETRSNKCFAEVLVTYALRRLLWLLASNARITACWTFQSQLMLRYPFHS